MTKDALPALEEIVTHRGSMLLLDRILSCENEICLAEYTPRRDGWYANEKGDMPAWIGVELMAQAVAAQVGIAKRRAGLPPGIGALLGTRSYKTTEPCFRASEVLRIRAHRLFQDESGLAAYDCEILKAADPDQRLATATLKVFESDDFAVFAKGLKE